MRFFSRVFLPFLLLVYIGIETYLKLHHSSLCDEIGCKLAGELLKFNPIYLNYFGFISVLTLFFIGYRSLKNTIFETLFFLVLYSAIAFEATILSYQFIVNPEACLFCLGVFSSLLLIALFNHGKHFHIVIAVTLSIFLGLITLAIPQNKSFITSPGIYLIQSETCSHCKKVKTYFADHKIEYSSISSKEINARAFLKFLDMNSIPFLVIKEESSMKLLKGDKNIIAYFDAQSKEKVSKNKEDALPTQSSTLDLSTDFLKTGGDTDCTLTITETPSCADNNATPKPQH